jgi:predicted CXXCH cytochrome family protein
MVVQFMKIEGDREERQPMNPQTKSPQNKYSRKAHSRRKTKTGLSPAIKILITLAGVGILVAASGFGYAASRESHDSFCASCHTQPESTYYQREQASQPTDLASAHTPKNVRCIDCHSGAGVTGRMSAELMGAHNAIAWYTGKATQPAPLTRSIGDVNCLKCHQDVTQKQPTENNHFHVFLSRWQQADPAAATCVSCHQGHNTNGSADIGFLEQATTEAVCENCHNSMGE